MPPATHPSPSRRRRIAVVALSALVALFSGILAYGAVKPLSVAATHVFVDTATPSVVHRPVYPVSALIQRAELLGRVVTSPPMLEQIARRARVPADQIAGDGRVTANVPAAFTEPGSEERASAILTENLPYRVEIEGRQSTPVLDIYTHAPTTDEAVRMANAAVAALEQRLTDLADEQALPASDRVVLRQLGSARGGVANGGMAVAIGVIAFIVVLASLLAVMRYLMLREPRQARPASPGAPRADGVWPHTTRLMPWMFALFFAVVWLLPFDQIRLNIPVPIDLTFDRLLLPVVVAMLLLAWLAGGSAAPRLRVTPIHAAVGAFVVCAFLSVILNADSLNQSLELDGALKRLPLLVSYVSVFVIASSALRSTEVRAFLTYTLGLAIVCAIGVLWEYRFKQNLFYEYAGKLLPDTFEVGKVDSAAVDDLGRRMVRGPAEVPLETVAMLAMALPIPLVRLTQSEGWRDRLIYGVAACLLFAAAFATFRKSALLAPVSVVGTLAYFRRRELLKLAPLALLLVVIIPVLAPGALRLTTSQFEPGRLGVATVSDRASDYDAVRPDIWGHLLFGKGWGSYNHGTYRVLDSEILHRIIEMGVFGLLTFLFMIVSVIWVARSTIAERDRTWAPLALTGTAAAVAFGMVSTLFDVMSFPHAVYIFLCTAGLVSVVVSHHKEESEARRERHARLSAALESAAGDPRGDAPPPEPRSPVRAGGSS